MNKIVLLDYKNLKLIDYNQNYYFKNNNIQE